jgi:hypothetical protein
MSSYFDNGGFIGVNASFSNTSNLILNNLILRLDAAESESYPGSGTTWFDISDKNNNGILTNGPVYNNTYFDFDGNDDYVDLGTIATSNALQLSSPAGGGLTIMFASWFDTGGDGFQRVIDKSNSGSAANGWAIYPNNASPNAGSLIFQENSGPGQSSLTTPSANTWEIWAYTWSVSGGDWVWYRNGAVLNSGTRTYSIPSVATNLRIGTWNHSDARELNGRIGFMLVYEKPLSSAEVLHNYNLLKGRFGL